MEAHSTRHEDGDVKGNAGSLAADCRFKLTGHRQDKQNRDYLVVETDCQQLKSIGKNETASVDEDIAMALEGFDQWLEPVVVVVRGCPSPSDDLAQVVDRQAQL